MSYISALMSPNASFQILRDKGRILLPIIFLSLFSVLIIWINMPIINKEILIKLNEIEQPLSRDSLILISQISGLVFAAISMIAVVVVTAILLLLINTLIQGEAKFKQLVRVVIASSIPGLISGIITAILLKTTDGDSLTSIVLSPAALLEEKQGFLFSLMNLLNPFSLWSLVIIIIGTSIMTNRSVAKVVPYIIFGWLILGLLFGMMGN